MFGNNMYPTPSTISPLVTGLANPMDTAFRAAPGAICATPIMATAKLQKLALIRLTNNSKLDFV